MTKKIALSSKHVMLVANDDYLPVLMGLLDHAKKSIDILAYSFAIGSSSGKLTTSGAPYQIAEKLLELKKKHGSKLTIRLYVEGRRETADRNQVTAEFLRRGGVKIKYGSTHAKGFSMDGRYVLFGSTNLTHQSIMKNNETNLLFDETKIYSGFEKYFNHLWKGGKHGGVKLSPPMLADGAFKDALVKLIGAAKTRLDFSIYFFHHTEIETALIRAHERGVKVRGLIHNHASFAMSYVRRTRGTAERLKAAGINDLSFGPSHLFTHSKYLVRDRQEVLLGTGNWLHEDVKVHPQLYVQIHNPPLARQMSTRLGKQVSALL